MERGWPDNSEIASLRIWTSRSKKPTAISETVAINDQRKFVAKRLKARAEKGTETLSEFRAVALAAAAELSKKPQRA